MTTKQIERTVIFSGLKKETHENRKTMKKEAAQYYISIERAEKEKLLDKEKMVCNDRS